MTRVAVIRDRHNGRDRPVGLNPVDGASVRAEVIPVNMLDAAEIERSVTAFARGANGGLVLTASGSAFVHHDLIIALARRPAGAGAD